jgi:hypothetical protein
MRSSKYAQLGALLVQMVRAGRASSRSFKRAGAHEHQMRPRLGSAEQMRSAHRAEAPVRHIATVGEQSVVASFAADFERRARETRHQQVRVMMGAALIE